MIFRLESMHYIPITLVLSWKCNQLLKLMMNIDFVFSTVDELTYFGFNALMKSNCDKYKFLYSCIKDLHCTAFHWKTLNKGVVDLQRCSYDSLSYLQTTQFSKFRTVFCRSNMKSGVNVTNGIAVDLVQWHAVLSKIWEIYSFHFKTFQCQYLCGSTKSLFRQCPIFHLELI